MSNAITTIKGLTAPLPTGWQTWDTVKLFRWRKSKESPLIEREGHLTKNQAIEEARRFNITGTFRYYHITQHEGRTSDVDEFIAEI